MASTYESTPVERIDARAWSEALDSNARSALLFSLQAASFMKKAGAGRIVNFSDWLPASGRPRYRGYVPYYTAKAAVMGLTQSLALDLSPEVLVNAVAPGPIVPPDGMTTEEEARVIAATPLRRWGGGEEIAKAVLFLVETDFVGWPLESAVPTVSQSDVSWGGLHEPKASHLSVLSAFAGRDHLARAYQAAVQHGYLWHEFGDLHLITR